MTRNSALVLGITIITLLSINVTSAGEKDMLLCLPGFPGTTTQAQPFVDKVLRHLETKLSWPAGSMKGTYLPDGDGVFEHLDQEKPGIALLDPSVYAREHSKRKMKVIAKVEVNGRGEETYAVITRKDGPKSLADLAGKKIEGVIVHDPKYIFNVLFDRAIPLEKLHLQIEKRPLKALRDVVRGLADAAIIDRSVRDHLSELPFASEIQIIFESKPVPAPAVVVMGDGLIHAAKFAEVLVGMCSRPDGQELCATLTISSIKAAADADYKNLLTSYNR